MPNATSGTSKSAQNNTPADPPPHLLPHPRTSSGNPITLHPYPFTIYPVLFTLYQIPCTLNPLPFTLYLVPLPFTHNPCRWLPPVSLPHHLSARTHRLCAGALTSGRCTTPSPPSGDNHRVCSFSVTTDMFPTGGLLANAAHSCAQEGCSGN